MNGKINISEIETYLYGLMNRTVSSHTYVGTLPETIKASWTDMLLIDCDNGVNDKGGYGAGNILLFTYARPRSDGSKNVQKLKELDEAVNAIIKEQDSSKDYYFYRKKTYSDYDTTRNWHCNVIVLGITVK